MASLIPGASFVPLRGRNHILRSDEPAWPRFLAEMHKFLAADVPAPGRLRAAAGLRLLSPRERQVLALVAAGQSNGEIADELSLSIRTVERHLSNIYTKLGVSGSAARAAAAVQGARRSAGIEIP